MKAAGSASFFFQVLFGYDFNFCNVPFSSKFFLVTTSIFVMFHSFKVLFGYDFNFCNFSKIILVTTSIFAMYDIF